MGPNGMPIALLSCYLLICRLTAALDGGRGGMDAILPHSKQSQYHALCLQVITLRRHDTWLTCNPTFEDQRRARSCPPFKFRTKVHDWPIHCKNTNGFAQAEGVLD